MNSEQIRQNQAVRPLTTQHPRGAFLPGKIEVPVLAKQKAKKQKIEIDAKTIKTDKAINIFQSMRGRASEQQLARQTLEHDLYIPHFMIQALLSPFFLAIFFPLFDKVFLHLITMFVFPILGLAQCLILVLHLIIYFDLFKQQQQKVVFKEYLLVFQLIAATAAWCVGLWNISQLTSDFKVFAAFTNAEKLTFLKNTKRLVPNMLCGILMELQIVVKFFM